MIVRDDAAVGSRSLGEARDAADNDAAARAARLGSGADVIDLMASVSRGGSMRRILMVLATALSMVLLVCGVAAADTVATDFEPPPSNWGPSPDRMAGGALFQVTFRLSQTGMTRRS
jgi:hypothetical protein